MNNAPIGIFDSGMGGLTVAREVLDQLPHEEIFYVGDTKNTPYGNKAIAEIRHLALAIMDDLVSKGVKMLVIACNTASSAMLHDARERYQQQAGIPVVEVIRPAVARAAAVTRNGKIGVIGTSATIGSNAYLDAFAAAPNIEVTQQACPRFVELVEAGITTGPDVFAATEEYLTPVKEAGVDTLILGCTHYPLLEGPIAYEMGKGVALVSSSQECAQDVYRALVENDLLRDSNAPAPQHRISDTGGSRPFAALARRILGPVQLNTFEDGER